MADFSFEKKLWKKGFKVVIGADEVGRGAWAGPVVASAVAWPLQFKISNLKFEIPEGIQVDDSKKLTELQRERAEKWIKENALVWGIGEAPVGAINRLGIGKATRIAFRSAVADLKVNADFLLIDAFYLPYTKGLKRKNQLAIIHGDEKSFSIAAASIIAKVYRDRKMQQLSRKYPKYKWDKNKGYGTQDHKKAILNYGPTRLHRRMFIRKIANS